MNYLISAYSINPYNGSEDGVGWNWVLQYEKNYKPGDRIIVLTKKCNEEATRRGIKEFGIQHVELAVCDVPSWLNWHREKYSMFHHMYYILWQHWAWRWVKHSKIKFDVIHHVTMGDYRIIGEMYKAKGTKTIFGPVGGAQVTPKSLMKYEKKKLFAMFRTAVNRSRSFNPFYIRGVRKFTYVFPSNRETYEQLVSIRGKENTSQMVEIGIFDEYKYLDIEKKPKEKVKILYAGRLIEKKGVVFLIEIASKLRERLDYQLEMCGGGYLEPVVRKMIQDYHLEQQVTLHTDKTHNEMLSEYADADIFIMPSLRETGGTVLIEAMANKIPIVALDMSFCSTLKEQGCGIFINTEQSLDDIKEDFCKSIIQLAHNPALREKYGENGYQFANKELTWETKYKTVLGSISDG